MRYESKTKATLIKELKSLQRKVHSLEKGNHKPKEELTKIAKRELGWNWLFDKMIEGCMIIGHDWKYLYVNETAAKHGMQKPENLIGKTMLEMYPGVEKSEIFAKYKRCMIDRAPQQFENKFTFQSGITKWYLINVHPVPDGIFVLSLDITKRKLAEENLKKVESSLNEAQQLAHLGNWELDLTNNILQWSDEIYRIFEIDPKKFGASYEAFLEAIHPDDREFVNNAYTYSVNNKSAYSIDHRLLFPDGRIKFVHEECQTFYDKHGKPVCSVGTVQDITERKSYEQALLTASLYTRGLIEASLDPLITISQEGVITDVNHATEEVTGFLREQLIGKDFSDFFSEPGEAREGYKKVLKEGIVRDYPLQIRHISGKTTDVLYNATVYKNQKGELQGIFAAARDITERKKTEELIRLKNEYNRRLIEASLDPLVTIGPDGKITDVNKATESITGVLRAELIGTDFSNYFTEPEKAKAGYKEVFEKGFVRDYPLEIRRQDGAIFSVLYNASIYKDEQGKVVGVFAAARDITERKRVEDALHASEEKFLKAFRLSPVALTLAGIDDGILVEANDAFEQITGYAAAEVLGRTAHDIELFPAPYERERFTEMLRTTGQVRNAELCLRHKSGTLRIVLCFAETIAIGNKQYILTTAEDITERKLREQEIESLNRVYKVLSETNQLIVREKDRDRLLEGICRIIVEHGKLSMAAVSFVDEQSRKVIPFAWYGKEEGYLSSVSISIDDVPEGRGPTGTAIREKRYVFSADIANESTMVPWKEQALKRGYRSLASFPLIINNKVIGVFTVYAGETDFFKENELTLLDELTMDVSYALQNIEIENSRKSVLEALVDSEEKFRQLASSAQDSIVMMDEKGKFFYWNKSFEKLFGYTSDEIEGKEVHSTIVPHRYYEDYLKGVARYKETGEGCAIGKTMELYAVKKDAKEFPVELSVSTFMFKGERMSLGILRDITERKNAEEERLFHFKFMESLDKVTRAIHGTNDLNQMINDVLRTVFSIFDCDRIWLFYPCDPDAPSFRVPIEITKPEYPGAKALNVDIPMPPDMSQNLREALESPDPLTYIVGTEKPVNKVSAEQFGVQSQMFIALHPKSGKPWVFGMHQCSTPRIWTGEEIKLFKEISSRISDGLSTLLFLNELQKSEERFRRLAENARDVIYRMSLPDGNYEYISPAAFAVFGYSPEEFYSTPTIFKQVIHPDWQKYFEEQWVNLIKGEMPPTYEYQIIHKSGEVRWLNQRNILVYDNARNPIAIEGIVTDITERKRAEDEIVKRSRLLEALFTNHMTCFVLLDKDFNFIRVNEAYARACARDVSDFPGHNHFEFYPSDAKLIFEEVVRSKKPFQVAARPFEFEDHPEWGVTYWDWTLVPILDSNGEVEFLVFSLNDVTERVIAEQELQTSNGQLRQVFDNIDAVVFSLDIEHGKLLKVSKACEKVYGFGQEKFFENPRIWMTLIHPEDLPAVQANWQSLLAHKKTASEVEYRIIRQDGKTRWIRNETKSIANESGKTIRLDGISYDITERRNAEKEIRKLSEAVEQSPVSVVIADVDANIEYVNKAFEKTTGYTFEEVIHRNPKIIQSGSTPKETYKDFWETITSGRTWKGEFLNKRKNGELFWENEIVTPLFDKNNRIINYLAIKQDVTEIKKMTQDLIAAKDRAEKSDRLKTEFLQQMSHEIRSPMNVTISLSNLIKEEVYDKVDPEIHEYFEGIDLAGKRLIRTVDLILNTSEMYVGTYEPTFTTIDIFNEILKPLKVEFVSMASEKGLEFVLTSSLPECRVTCDKYSVTQIFSNLMDNAIKYTPHGQVEILISRDKQNNVKVSIADTGIGISNEFLSKLFEPFTQEDRGYSRRYEGNGLGLALVKKYCDLNNAIINVESAKGKGSKFTVTFLNKSN